MSKRENWHYNNGKLTGKTTTHSSSDGSKRIVHQKAYSGLLGGRHATKITSETRIDKNGNSSTRKS